MRNRIFYAFLGVSMLGFLLTAVYANSYVNEFSDQDLNIGNEETGIVSVGRDVNLDGTNVNGGVSAGRTIQARNCHISGNLSAGEDASLNNCTWLDTISTGRNLTLFNSTVNHDVSAGLNLNLFNTIIHGSASAAGEVTLENTHIDNTLAVAVPHLVLNKSTIATIRLTVPNSGGMIHSNNGVVINGSANGSVISNSRVFIGNNENSSLVTVGSGSVSNINGYTVKANDTETTVMTPDNSAYINGRKVYGVDASCYTDYRQSHPEAPQIAGPGWQDQPSNAFASQAPMQIVELTNNSIVTGNIIFEGSRGKVIVRPGSLFKGNVEGGTVETISSN
jgi:hypothetical protein